MNPNPGDVVFIDFPYADQASSKLRPALVIAMIPGKYNDVLIAAISSRLYQAVPDFDEVIRQTDEDFQLTGLKIPSLVRLGKLTSVESQMISARLGNISSARLVQIKERISAWLMGKIVLQ